MTNNLVTVHFIHNSKLLFKKNMHHVPRVGDEIRLVSDEFYTAAKIVWIYDEPEQPFERVNVGLIKVD